MADFLPIKLGKNANGAVTHLQEISLSDKIPESYLQVSSNTVAKWNASSIQGSPVSSLLNPSANQVLIYTGSVWTASSIVTGGGGVTDHGALTGLADDDHPQYVLSATNNALSSTVSNHIASASVHFTQAQIDHGVILGLGDNDHPQYVLSATNSALSSTVSNHIASAVHWDLSTLNINYINASGDSANAAFYFQTVSATTLSATTISTPKYPTYIYTATGISVGTNKLMFDMFNGAGSGKTLKVTRIVAYVRNTTTIAGINQVLECYRTSSVGTGGTTVTEAKMVTTDPALNANITARNTPTGGASYYNSSGVLAAANIYTEEGQNLQERVYLYMYDSFAGLEDCLTLQQGEGIRINTGAVGAAGVIAIYVYFITV